MVIGWVNAIEYLSTVTRSLGAFEHPFMSP